MKTNSKYLGLVRPSVANISNIYITFSVEEPELNLSQVNRFLISAESMGVEVSLVLPTPDGPIKIEHFFCFNSANKLLKLSDFSKFKVIA